MYSAYTPSTNGSSIAVCFRYVSTHCTLVPRLARNSRQLLCIEYYTALVEASAYTWVKILCNKLEGGDFFPGGHSSEPVR